MSKKEKVLLNLGDDLESIDNQLDEALDNLKSVNSRVIELLHTEDEEEEPEQDNQTQNTIGRINPVHPTSEPSTSSGESSAE